MTDYLNMEHITLAQQIQIHKEEQSEARELAASILARRKTIGEDMSLATPAEEPTKKAAPPLSLEQVIEFRKRMFDKSMALVEKKGADYNRDQQASGDTLFNLRVAELLGVVDSTEAGILVRLSDKLMRLISLTKPGREAEVKDESVLDTIRDIHNYVDYLGIIWQSRRKS